MRVGQRFVRALLFFAVLASPVSRLASQVPAPAGPGGESVSLDPMAILENETKIQVGDILTFRIIEDRDEALKFLVRDTGEIDFPYVGKYKVAGKTPKQVAYELKPLMEKTYYYQATVLIAFDNNQKTRGKIYLSGGVQRQGEMDIPLDQVFTVSKAILRAGGFTADADRTKVKIERRKEGGGHAKELLEVNVAEILDGGQSNKDLVLESEDLLIIPQKGAGAGRGQVTLSGAVGKEGPINLPSGKFTASDAILAAGGFAKFADKKVRLIRPDPTDPKKYKEMTIDVGAVLDKGRLEEDVELQPDDRIIVKERLFNFN